MTADDDAQAAAIRRAVASWPPLSAQQRVKLAQALLGVPVPEADRKAAAFWEQWDRHVASARSAAKRLADRSLDAVAKLDAGEVPAASIAATASQYETELAALDALREFGSRLGITTTAGKAERL